MVMLWWACQGKGFHAFSSSLDVIWATIKGHKMYLSRKSENILSFLCRTLIVLLWGFPFESGHTVTLWLAVQVVLHIVINSHRCWPPAWQRISVRSVWGLRTSASDWWTKSWVVLSSLRCTAGRRRFPTAFKVRQRSTTPTQTVALT